MREVRVMRLVTIYGVSPICDPNFGCIRVYLVRVFKFFFFFFLKYIKWCVCVCV